MPTLPFIIMLLIMLCGLGVIYMGLQVWKHQKIAYLHSHHRDSLNKDDIPEYSRKIGRAIVLIGFGVVITSLLFILAQATWTWAIFALCFIVGIAEIFRTVRRYNG
ncbi:MAG: hypothetical protein Q4E07_01975 [Eubacteriales bacterium]|nr:hypothetical protein [Eubacteriales bacterium]